MNPERDEKYNDRNIEGLVTVIEMIIYDEETRERFLDNAPRTLESMGVQIRDRALLKTISERLRDAIEGDIARRTIPDPGPKVIAGPAVVTQVNPATTTKTEPDITIDPIGPVADAGTTVATAVATGAATGVATYAATKTANSDLAAFDDEWDQVVLDFSRIELMNKYLRVQKETLSLKMVNQQQAQVVDALSRLKNK
jgi:hypothetical protein